MGRVPEVPLCVMCKVDGCFVLIPINEVTQMRPDMSTFVTSAYVKDEVPKEEEDVDYKPPVKPGAKASTGKASSSKATKAKAVKVCTFTLTSPFPSQCKVDGMFCASLPRLKGMLALGTGGSEEKGN